MGITEHQLLKHIIDNNQLITTVQPEIFDKEFNEIFQLIKRLDREGLKPTMYSLTYLCNKHEMLTELACLPLIEAAKPIDHTVFQLVKEELLVTAKKRLIERTSISLNEMDPKDWKAFNDKLTRLDQKDEPELLKSSSFFQFDKHIEADGVTIGSGLTFLENTGSDFKLGQLISFLAPSGHGKSQLLGHVAKHLFTSGKNVLTIVFEETESQFNTRIGQGLLSKTNYGYKQLTSEELELEFASKFNSRLGNLDVITGTAVAVELLEELIDVEEEARGYKYDAIIIDYSKQLVLKDSNKNSQEWQKIGDVFRILKEICMKKNKERLIITAVQSNRDGYKKNKAVGAENIADSMGPMHNCDMMISIQRQETGLGNEIVSEESVQPLDITNVLKLHIVKKRLGTAQQGTNYYYNLLRNNNLQFIIDTLAVERLEQTWSDETREVLNS